MTAVVVVGCGIIGAAIAYELSQVPGLSVTVLDRQLPAQAATGAALGVLMGAISQKLKGNALLMRLQSIQRYNEWIPQLQAITGHQIAFNQQGILRLCIEGDDLAQWHTLSALRQSQGWTLHVVDRPQLAAQYPYLNLDHVVGGVYSPQDRQIDPTALTLALVDAAQHHGVRFEFGCDVTATTIPPTIDHPAVTPQRWQAIQTTNGLFTADWLVIAAGLGSTPLAASLHQPINLRPVLGQALQIALPQPLAPTQQPVITADDVHLVPVGDRAYWVGATVEFPPDALPLQLPLEPDPAALEWVRQRAIAFCPAVAHATITRTWSGCRPRPQGRPAPIVERLPGYENVLVATGHYRNGVLLAPATAASIRDAIVAAK